MLKHCVFNYIFLNLLSKHLDRSSFPGSSTGKESSCNAGDPGLIPGLGISPGEGMTTHSSVLAWRIPMKRSLAG